MVSARLLLSIFAPISWRMVQKPKEYKKGMAGFSESVLSLSFSYFSPPFYFIYLFHLKKVPTLLYGGSTSTREGYTIRGGGYSKYHRAVRH